MEQNRVLLLAKQGTSEDVALALQATGMKTSPDRTVLDLG